METAKSQNRQIVFLHTFRSYLATALVISILAGCAGNSKMGSGAKTGAVIGAGIGLLMGAVTGKSEAAAVGMAVGAGVGAGEGAYEGWKQDQDDQRTKQITDAIRESKQGVGQQPSGNAETRAREELTRFLGVWAMEGWIQEADEKRSNVQARVNADIQMSYFVELAYIDLKVTGVDKQIWGTSTIGYDKNNGYNIITRFNTIPEPLRSAGGTFDHNSRSFTFKGPDYRLIFRFQSPDRFTAETFVTTGGEERKVESYTFTRT